jgi:hypothetical protein
MSWCKPSETPNGVKASFFNTTLKGSPMSNVISLQTATFTIENWNKGECMEAICNTVATINAQSPQVLQDWVRICTETLGEISRKSLNKLPAFQVKMYAHELLKAFEDVAIREKNAAEQLRLATIEDEKLNTSIRKIYEAIIIGLKNIRTGAEARLQRAKDRVMECGLHRMGHEMADCFAEAVYQGEMLNYVASRIGFFESQLNEPSYTYAQTREFIERELANVTRSLFEDASYRHNCTHSASNEVNIQKFRAQQGWGRLLQTLVDSIRRDEAASADRDVESFYCARIHFYGF